jgi:hypothetical protein
MSLLSAPEEFDGANVAELAATVARQIAPDGNAPADGPAFELWQTLLKTVDRVYGCGVHRLGRLPFLGDRLLVALAAEARRQLRALPDRGERVSAPPGPLLQRLAASRQLRDAVAASTGFPVTPSYEACHLYDPPGSHVGTHIDSPAYPMVVHLTLEHTGIPAAGGGSSLVVHLPGERRPARLAVPTGEAVVLYGRGTIHSWEPLGADERRILLGIGFERRASP